MKQFDVVGSASDSFHDLIGVVLVTDIEVPCYEDGLGSDAAFVPLDIRDPNEWCRSFPGCIVYNLVKDRMEVWNQSNLKPLKVEKTDEYVPFDMGTSKLRAILGLIKLGDNCGFLKKHLRK